MSFYALFTVDIESYFHALVPYQHWPEYERKYGNWVVEATRVILDLLRPRGIRGIFYTLGHVAEHHGQLVKKIREDGHLVGSHGYYHQHWEYEGDPSDNSARAWLGNGFYPYRSPYWYSTKRPNYGGGAYFRFLPYWWVKREVERSKIFYIHPHDIVASPSDCRFPVVGYLQARRMFGVKQAKKKFERLLGDFNWLNPNELLSQVPLDL